MTKYYYFYECLDGQLGEKYLTPPDVAEIIKGKREELTEGELKAIARNYEATLYRYEKDSEGNYTNEVCLYDCFAM